MMKDESLNLFSAILHAARAHDASDIHLIAGLPPAFRVSGEIITASDCDPLSREALTELAEALLTPPQRERLEQERELSISYFDAECGRIRLSLYHRIGVPEMAIRMCNLEVKTAEELMLPPVLERLAALTSGLVIVTGPTGMGKTTTLNYMVDTINRTRRGKIITIEDPVEYQLPGVLQIPVNEKKGLTFARGLRSILRHDPDKIMVGEIRDPETAQIAVQSALTGHLVFTTVHANNVFDVIGRFIHMGVDPYSFVSALNGIMAQRLVRVSCPHCAVDVEPDAALLADSGVSAGQAAGMHFRAGRGCGHCRGTGFKGRRAIGEILHLNEEIRELIIARQPVRLIREAARRNGTRFLREIALDMVAAGETTLQEINRVTVAD